MISPGSLSVAGYRDTANCVEADGLDAALDGLFAASGSSLMSLAIVPGERLLRDYGYIRKTEVRERFRSAPNSR